MMIRDKHPLAGKTVTIRADVAGSLGGQEYRVKDWWQNVAGMSWMDAVGNPAAINYAMRAVSADLPTDDEVLYGKVGAFGFLVHVSEIEDAGATR